MAKHKEVQVTMTDDHDNDGSLADHTVTVIISGSGDEYFDGKYSLDLSSKNILMMQDDFNNGWLENASKAQKRKSKNTPE